LEGEKKDSVAESSNKFKTGAKTVIGRQPASLEVLPTSSTGNDCSGREGMTNSVLVRGLLALDWGKFQG